MSLFEAFKEQYEINFGEIPLVKEGDLEGYQEWVEANIHPTKLEFFMDKLIDYMGDSKARPKLRDLKRTLDAFRSDLKPKVSFQVLGGQDCLACGKWNDRGLFEETGWLSHWCMRKGEQLKELIFVPCKCDVGEAITHRSNYEHNERIRSQIYSIRLQEGREKLEDRKPLPKETCQLMAADLVEMVHGKMTREQYREKWNA